MDPGRTTADEEVLSQDSKVMLDLSSDLNEYLPPWRKATSEEKRRLVLFYMGVYFPVLYSVFTISLIATLFIGFYIYPILSSQNDDPALWYWHSESEKRQAQIRAWILLGIFSWVFINLSISFTRATTTDPGKVPKESPWLITGEELDSSSKLHNDLTLAERRKDGFVRQCLKCYKRKPDRCHHCRLCERCVLKMDHHCPWVANCIGYYNYKYFFLVVFYSAVGLLIFAGAFWETVVITLNNNTVSPGFCLFIMSTYTCGSLLAIALVSFLAFHLWLISRDYTTIEFCEKRRAQGVMEPSVFRESFYKSLQSCLGRNPLTWLIPTNFRTDDDQGLYFKRFDAKC